MNTHQYLMNSHLGFCIKDSKKNVLFQNGHCIERCGHLQGRVCAGACIEKYEDVCRAKGGSAVGFVLFPKLALEKGMADAMMFRDGEQLVTVLYPQEDQNEKKMNFYRECGLTKTELNIMSLLLNGFTNAKIAQKLFISKATLKTHINNIYKKIPASMRPRN